MPCGRRNFWSIEITPYRTTQAWRYSHAFHGSCSPSEPAFARKRLGARTVRFLRYLMFLDRMIMLSHGERDDYWHEICRTSTRIQLDNCAGNNSHIVLAFLGSPMTLDIIGRLSCRRRRRRNMSRKGWPVNCLFRMARTADESSQTNFMMVDHTCTRRLKHSLPTDRSCQGSDVSGFGILWRVLYPVNRTVDSIFVAHNAAQGD